MEFTEIPRYAKDKYDVRNKGWIHQDVDILGNDDLAGLIYLTPDIDPDSGTILYNLKSSPLISTLEHGLNPM